MGALGLAMALAIINTNLTFAEEGQGTAAVAVAESASTVSEAGMTSNIVNMVRESSDTASTAIETAAATDNVAGNNAAESTKSAGASRPQELQQAMDAVQKLVDREDGCESTTYPGIKNYLEGLLEKANNGTTSEAEYRELLAALNEGAEGANLLLGVDRKDTAELAVVKDTKLPVSFYVSEKDDAKTPDTGTVSPELLKEYQRQQAAQNNVVRVTENDIAPEDDGETAVEDTTQDDEKKTAEAEKEQQKVAVPRTNESKANAPMLAIAGASVVIATAGATVLLLRSKKKR